jgi:hypothetical protein
VTGIRSASPDNFSWRPILSGSEAATARETAWRIVDYLKTELLEGRRTAPSWRLINGLAGFALTIDYARQCDLDVPPSLAAELIADGVRLAANDPDPSLYFGLAGLGWAGEVVGAWARLGTDLAEEFDAQLTEMLGQSFSSQAHSLFRGLAGLGVYALQRVHRTGPKNATLVVQRLRESAITDRIGTAWLTDGRLMLSPGGGSAWFSLGFPQGFLAVISFLASASQARICGAHELLRSSARWLHAQRVSNRPGQCFPVSIDGQHRSFPDRLGWCNGDLPVALTLLQAGTAAEEPTWIDTAREVASLAAAMPPFEPDESSLCHGDSGIGFCFAFLHNILRAPELLAAARHWFGRALSRRTPGAVYEGYQAFFENPRDTLFVPRRTSSGQFLRGAGGIALALLAASGSVSPEWAGALMLPWRSFATGGRVG